MWEALSRARMNTRRLLVHKYPSLSIARYLYSWVNWSNVEWTNLSKIQNGGTKLKSGFYRLRVRCTVLHSFSIVPTMCSRRRQPGFTPNSRPILPLFDAFSRRPLRPAVTLPSAIVCYVSATCPGRRPGDPVVWLASPLPSHRSFACLPRDVGVVYSRLWQALSVGDVHTRG